MCPLASPMPMCALNISMNGFFSWRKADFYERNGNIWKILEFFCGDFNARIWCLHLLFGEFLWKKMKVWLKYANFLTCNQMLLNQTKSFKILQLQNTARYNILETLRRNIETLHETKFKVIFSTFLGEPLIVVASKISIVETKWWTTLQYIQRKIKSQNTIYSGYNWLSHHQQY